MNLPAWLRGKGAGRDPAAHIGDLAALANVKGDKLGDWSQKHQTGDVGRGTSRGLRISVFGNVILVLVVYQLAVALSSLTPLRRDVPWLMQTYGEDRAVAEVRPVVRPDQWQEAVAEYEVTRYVRVRHEIVPDLPEMDRRWGVNCARNTARVSFEDGALLCSYMMLHTGQQEYARFIGQIEPVPAFIRDGYHRGVRILQEPLRMDTGLYEVRFLTTDWRERKMREGPAMPGEPEKVREKEYVARVWIEPFQGELLNGNRHLNLARLQVWKYELAESERSAATGTGGANR